MTGKELYTTVSQMGFARTLDENEPYFYRAANLSLSRITRRFPLLSSCPLPYVDGRHTAKYEMDDLVSDFVSFPREPLFLDGVPLTEGRHFRIEDGCIYLARDVVGVPTVRYFRRARPITPDEAEEEIDIPPYAESLLPTLTASYLWLDDRGELATHYLALYRTEAEELARALNRHGGARVISRNGWEKGYE